jgi:BirA family biotin operon repressor/biotin-[acetyl-CoA-carboxylase] ligase
MGRAWESPEGNLHCSTLVRLRPGDPPAHTLALVAAVAVHALVAPLCAGQARIKWPNDIMVGEAKLSGMLLERAGDAVVIGIGINVTGAPSGLDRPVTSLWAQGAVDAEAGALCARLAEIFAHWLSIWRAQGVDPVRAHWVANAHAEGTPLRVALPDGQVVEGGFGGLDSTGALILRLANGARRAIHAGDVFLI